MNTLDTIMARRAVKHYDSTHVMPKEDEQKLLELAKNSPTSFNMQNWRFVIVRDMALRTEIRAAAWNQAQVTDASLLLVICADLKAWDKNPERYWVNAPQQAQDILVPMIKPFYQGKEELQRDEAMRSVGMAAQTLMLAAKAMGYESSPMIGFDAETVAKLINLPHDHAVGMLLAIGKGTQPAMPKGGFLSYDEVVFENRFT